MSKQTSAPRGSVYVSCPFCGRQNKKAWCYSQGFKIVRCPCGMTYPNPRLSFEEISQLYNQQKISGKESYLAVEEGNKIDFQKRLSLIEKFISPGKLLDIGCNIGSLLEVAQARGWQGKGLDLNKEAIAEAQRRGLDCQVADFLTVDLTGEYDLVVMNDLIEHLPDPRLAIKKVFSLLRPGGIFYVATPRGDSLMARLAKGRWLHRKPQEHLFIFSKAVLAEMLAQEGFFVLDWRTIGRTRPLKVICQKLDCYFPWSAKLFSLLPSRWQNISLAVNPRDEMCFICQKKG